MWKKFFSPNSSTISALSDSCLGILRLWMLSKHFFIASKCGGFLPMFELELRNASRDFECFHFFHFSPYVSYLFLLFSIYFFLFLTLFFFIISSFHLHHFLIIIIIIVFNFFLYSWDSTPLLLPFHDLENVGQLYIFFKMINTRSFLFYISQQKFSFGKISASCKFCCFKVTLFEKH